jgi:hypothetical protein
MMNCRSSRVFALLFMLTWGFSPLAHNVSGGELPELKAAGPRAGDKYASASNVAIIGEFTPVFTTNIQVRVFHVLPNGLVIPQAGCSFTPRENGKFGVTIEPPPSGWIPGRTRAVVSLENLRQVKRELDFEAAGEAVAAPVGRAVLQPAASGLVVRLPLEEFEVYDLAPRTTYLVEGSFRPKLEYKGRVEGPLLFAECMLIRPDGSRLTCDSVSGPSFVQPDGSCWYQLQMLAPEKLGAYHVKLKTVALDAAKADAFGSSEYPFSIRVSEGAAAPKP